MRIVSFFILLLLFISFHAQSDCNVSGEACDNPSFQVSPNGYGNIEEFDFLSNISNPQTNPNASPGNTGCMLSGELNSTWLTINVTSSGNLEFSLGDLATLNGNCLDWIMWEYSPSTCNDIINNTLPPVACNYNGTFPCLGLSGMSLPGNLPAGADQSDFENAIAVTAGDQFIICISNYSSASTNVPLSFFGSAAVNCGSVTNPIICFGETAVIAAFEGVSFNWDTSIPGFISTNTAGDTAYVNPTVTTDYNVDITSANGSVQTETATVTVLAQINPTVNIVTETCIGDGNGSLTFTATNGVAPITYSLTGASSANNTNGVFNNLPAGNYTVAIEDANGCTAQLNATLDPGPPCCGMLLTTTKTDNACFGICNGVANVDTAGTSGPATIQWYDQNGTITGANMLSVNNLCAGTYTVEISDPLCTLTETVVITEPSELTVTESTNNLNCFQDNSGEITLNGSGGTSPYEYSIDNGSTFTVTATFSNLTADLYNLVIRDANNCTKGIQVTLTEPDDLSEFMTVQDNTCNVFNAPCNGEIETIISGGTLPFTYAWDNGLAPVANPTEVCANTYNLTVTDANGCILNVPSIIVNEPLAVTIDNINSSSPLCYSDCDGTMEIENSNATTFSVDNGTTFQTSNEFLGLCSGDYSIIVSNDDGCSTTDDISLLSPGAVLADFTFGPQPASTQNPEIVFVNTSINADSEFWYTVIMGDTVKIYETNATILFPESEPGNYEVCLVSSNINLCVDTICETVVIDDEFFIFVPNTFSPNSDGVNDIFYPVVNSYNKTNFEFLIFNRWGEIIFESDSPLDGWKGTYKSIPVKTDTYIWKINVQSETDGSQKSFTGHVNLIR